MTPTLEAILARALASEPSERYASAEEMAREIEDALRGRPVRAMAEQVPYYLARHALWRWRVPVASALVLFVMAVAGVLVLAAQNQQIAQERERALEARAAAEREAKLARELSTFMESVLIQADPTHKPASQVTVEEVLDESARRLLTEDDLSSSDRVRATLLRVMAETYLGLGAPQKGQRLVDEALELTPLPERGPCAGPQGASQLEPARLALAQARLVHAAGRYERAERLLLELLERCEPAAEVQGRDIELTAYGVLAKMYWWKLGQPNASHAYYERQASLSAADPERYARHRIHALLGLMIADRALGESPERRARRAAYLREADRLADHLWPHNHPEKAVYYNEVAYVISDLDRSIELRERMLAIYTEIHGPRHRRVAEALNELGLTLERANRIEESLKMQRRAYELMRGQVPPDDGLLTSLRNNLGASLREVGRLEEADVLLSRSVEVAPRLHSYSNLAQLRHRQGRYEEAIALNKTALELVPPPDPGAQHDFGFRAMLHQRIARQHEALGERAAAAGHWPRSLTLTARPELRARHLFLWSRAGVEHALGRARCVSDARCP